MPHWYYIFPKHTGLSLYIWIIFCILPFYFVIRSSSPLEITIGILLIVLFYATYQLLFLKKDWTVYVSLGMEIAISIGMTLYFGYVYFALFLAFFIGNVGNKAGFITLYVVHLVATVVSVSVGFFIQKDIFLTQFPFIIVCAIGVILLPLNMYHRNKQKQLEYELEHAHGRISELLIAEERQRIARDLHDTLGQKLSLIGLKSDLAGKLVDVEPGRAKEELRDIHRIARNALKEVRELISTMKSVKLKDEIAHVRQVLQAAEIELAIHGDPESLAMPLLVENVLCMCLKEAVTNVVKHSGASACHISFLHSPSEFTLKVADNGVGLHANAVLMKGNGLRGIRERLEFVNGSMNVESSKGTTVTIQVPRVIGQTERRELS